MIAAQKAATTISSVARVGALVVKLLALAEEQGGSECELREAVPVTPVLVQRCPLMAQFGNSPSEMMSAGTRGRAIKALTLALKFQSVCARQDRVPAEGASRWRGNAWLPRCFWNQKTFAFIDGHLTAIRLY